MAFHLKTNAFNSEGMLSIEHTLDGKNDSPYIGWQDVPEGTQSLALMMLDADNPHSSHCHWLVYDIPLIVSYLEGGLPRRGELSDGIKQGINDHGKIGFDGPNPPPDETHLYLFRLYALEKPPGLKAEMSKKEFLDELEHRLGILGATDLSIGYRRISNPSPARRVS